MNAKDAAAALGERGWCRFGFDPELAEWIDAVRGAALATITDPAHAKWHRSGGTWFAGVNALANDERGRVGEGPPLGGQAIRAAQTLCGPVGLDKGQVSVAWPGYPQQDGESEATFRFRVNRDAAHLDGLHRVGPKDRRHLREYHAFLLGIPVTETNPGASPLVVWEGSHRMIGKMLKDVLAGLDPADWGDPDLTDLYAETRRGIFATCRRVPVHAKPGEAYLLHRHALHGISPWQAGATAPAEGRVIVYFRPDMPDRAAWLGLGKRNP